MHAAFAKLLCIFICTAQDTYADNFVATCGVDFRIRTMILDAGRLFGFNGIVRPQL